MCCGVVNVEPAVFRGSWRSLNLNGRTRPSLEPEAGTGAGGLRSSLAACCRVAARIGSAQKKFHRRPLRNHCRLEHSGLKCEPTPAQREALMKVTGAVFQPELIELMRSVLEEAAATLPEAKRTSTMKAEIASQILACAAKGERNPTALKMAALLAVLECSHYSHDISPERRAV